MEKTFRLSNLSIDSVDSVDKGAGEGVRVVLMKRDSNIVDQQESEMNTDTISKAARLPERELIAFAKSGALTKSETYELIDRLAQEQRTRGETREIAITKYMTEDPCGRELYAAYRTLPVAKTAPRIVAADAAKPAGDDDALTQLRALAEQFRQTPAGKGMTREQAVAHVADTPEGRPLLDASKNANLQKQFALT